MISLEKRIKRQLVGLKIDFSDVNGRLICRTPHNEIFIIATSEKQIPYPLPNNLFLIKSARGLDSFVDDYQLVGWPMLKVYK